MANPDQADEVHNKCQYLSLVNAEEPPNGTFRWECRARGLIQLALHKGAGDHTMTDNTTRRNLRLPDTVWNIITAYQKKHRYGTLNASTEAVINNFGLYEDEVQRLRSENSALRTELTGLKDAIRQKTEAERTINHLVTQGDPELSEAT